MKLRMSKCSRGRIRLENLLLEVLLPPLITKIGSINMLLPRVFVGFWNWEVWFARESSAMLAETLDPMVFPAMHAKPCTRPLRRAMFPTVGEVVNPHSLLRVARTLWVPPLAVLRRTRTLQDKPLRNEGARSHFSESNAGFSGLFSSRHAMSRVQTQAQTQST